MMHDCTCSMLALQLSGTLYALDLSDHVRKPAYVIVCATQVCAAHANCSGCHPGLLINMFSLTTGKLPMCCRSNARAWCTQTDC